MISVRILVSGLVQGVFFRFQAKEKADALGLKGWVRNNNDGSVEMVTEGTEHSIKQLEQWCWKGPPKAKVTGVSMTPEPLHDFADFQILY